MFPGYFPDGHGPIGMPFFSNRMMAGLGMPPGVPPDMPNFAAMPPSGSIALHANTAVPSTETSPEVLLLPRVISIDEFCSLYKISNTDKMKLIKLEVELGD